MIIELRDVEVHHLVMEGKIRMEKEQLETSGAAQSVVIHVLLSNVSGLDIINISPSVETPLLNGMHKFFTLFYFA